MSRMQNCHSSSPWSALFSDKLPKLRFSDDGKILSAMNLGFKAMNDSLNKISKGRRVALWATAVTAGLAITKYLIGIYFESDILRADAVHSLADTAAIAASAFGLHLAGRAKTERFPYGLYRAETLALLFVGALIIFAGIDLIKEGVAKILSPAAGDKIPLIPAATAVFSIAVSAVVAWREYRVSREIKSRSLEANARESFYDILSSLVVLTGIILPAYNIPYIEGAIIILISLLVLKIGAESSLRSVLILLDANTDRALRTDIEDAIGSIRGIKGVSEIKIRETGPFKMVELKIMISPSATVYAANDLSERVKRTIHESFDNIETVLVDIKPARTEIYRAIIPVRDIDGMASRAFAQFGKSPYYAIVRIKGSECEIEDFYFNEFLDRERHVGLNVVKALLPLNIDMILTSKIGEISFYIVRDNLIDIYRLPEGEISIRKATEMFIEGKLEKMDKPTQISDNRAVNS
jgi:cation diffusion facilitator family transporter